MDSSTSKSNDIKQAQADLDACVLKYSWLFCVGGVALSVPISIRIKSYVPLVALGAAGTLMDELTCYMRCMKYRQALDTAQAREAGEA